jgi:cysteine synthase A
MAVFQDNLDTIGKTPLLEIRRLGKELGANILAKIEARNPAFSVKCRIGVAMIRAAEKAGLLPPGTKVIEATSGNTGIALAFTCAARGIPLTLTMPDTMSQERRAMLVGYGAELILTPGVDGMRGAIARAEELAAQPGWYMPRQFDNPANPQIHFETTGPEIWEDTQGKFDVFVSGVGTGGTITGVGRYLREIKKHKARMALSRVLRGSPRARRAWTRSRGDFAPTRPVCD